MRIYLLAPLDHIHSQYVPVARREGSLSASGAVIRAVPCPQLCLEPEALAYMFLEGVSNRPREGDSGRTPGHFLYSMYETRTVRVSPYRGPLRPDQESIPLQRRGRRDVRMSERSF
jgi:hypothetical protein